MSEKPSNKRSGNSRPYKVDYKKQKTSAAGHRGSTGILCSCDVIREREAVKEALNLLNEWADKLYPSTSGESPKETEKTVQGSVQDELEKEIAELKSSKNKGSTGRFAPLDTGVKGIILIRVVDKTIDPVHLVSSMLEYVKREQESISRHIVRMLPLQMTCYPGVDEIKAEMGKLMADFFEKNNSTKPLTYAVQLKKRNCPKIDSQAIIDACCEIIGDKHKVNLTEPQLVFMIEIFRTTCGVSILTNFHQLRKFNLRCLLEEKPSKVSEPKPTAETSTDTVAESAEKDK